MFHEFTLPTLAEGQKRIALQSILIEPAEGEHKGKSWKVSSWEEAQARMAILAQDAPKDMSYHKVECTMSFENGFQWKLTSTVFHPETPDFEDVSLIEEARNTLYYDAGHGRARQVFVDDREWHSHLWELSQDAALERRAVFARDLLIMYDFGQDT